MTLDNDYARRRVKALQARIDGPDDRREVENLIEEDREALIEFDKGLMRDRRRNNRCGWYHHGNLLSELLVFATETQSLAASLEEGEPGEKALDTIIDWIDEQGYSDYTVQGMLSTLRVFAATVLGELPDRFEEIEPGAHVDEDPAPLPSNIVEYYDLIDMMNEVDSTRDKALLSTQWSGGFRPMRELYTLQWENIEFQDDHAIIALPTQDGKTDRREIILIVGAPMLKKWVLEDHPVHDDPEETLGPDTFIWTKLNENKLLSYGAMTTRFEVAGERADIQKDHSAQHFRRSAASVLAGKPYISERDLRERFSWSPNSAAPEHYIAANSRATQVNVAMARGFDVEDIDESPETAPIVCERCGEWTMRGLDECIWCKHNLEAEQETFETPAMQHPQSGDKDLARMLLDGDVTANELRTLRKLEGQIRSEPQIFEEIDGLIKKAEALEETRTGDSALSVVDPGTAIAAASAAVGAVAHRWTQMKHVALSIHPSYEEYPPTPPRAGGIVAGWALLLVTGLALLYGTGVFSGSPSALLALAIGTSIGLLRVHRDLPTVDDAVEAAASQ